MVLQQEEEVLYELQRLDEDPLGENYGTMINAEDISAQIFKQSVKCSPF